MVPLVGAVRLSRPGRSRRCSGTPGPFWLAVAQAECPLPPFCSARKSSVWSGSTLAVLGHRHVLRRVLWDLELFGSFLPQRECRWGCRLGTALGTAIACRSSSGARFK